MSRPRPSGDLGGLPATTREAQCAAVATAGRVGRAAVESNYTPDEQVLKAIEKRGRAIQAAAV